LGDRLTGLAVPAETTVASRAEPAVVPGVGFWDTVLAYIEVTKPVSVVLLAFTAVVMMVVAGGVAAQSVSGGLFLQAAAAVILACAGANAVSCYLDRDLDAIMGRTRRRPVPSGRISPPARALYWGLFLFGLSLLLAWGLNLLAWATLWGGMLGYVVIYSLWLKRRSVWNIVIGGFSGGMPVLFGWAVVTGELSLLPVLIAALVVLWIPNHIWSLAIFYREEYVRVKVPMLPVVYDLRKTFHWLLLTVILMVVFSVLIYFAGDWGLVYPGAALVMGAAALVLSVHVYRNPERKKAWTLFKFSSPYLAVLFLSMMIDVWVR
jgi:protoheme IX farnesyltransferase